SVGLGFGKGSPDFAGAVFEQRILVYARGPVYKHRARLLNVIAEDFHRLVPDIQKHGVVYGKLVGGYLDSLTVLFAGEIHGKYVSVAEFSQKLLRLLYKHHQ